MQKSINDTQKNLNNKSKEFLLHFPPPSLTFTSRKTFYYFLISKIFLINENNFIAQ